MSTKYSASVMFPPAAVSSPVATSRARSCSAAATSLSASSHIQPGIQYTAQVQAVAQKALDGAIARSRASGNDANQGAAVVMTTTGRVVAMASYPDYDPSVWTGGISQRQFNAMFGKSGGQPIINWTTQGQYAPGSTFKVTSTAAAVANEYFVGAINRVGVEPLGDNDFYGQTYFADPRGQLMGDAASDDKDEVLVRDLDMDQLAEVRNLWQFYRDRRPDQYGPLVQP